MAKMTVFLKDNCLESSQALDVVSWLKNFVPTLEVKLINCSREDVPKEIKDIDAPVYEIGGQFFAGKLGREHLRVLLKAFAEGNMN